MVPWSKGYGFRSCRARSPRPVLLSQAQEGFKTVQVSSEYRKVNWSSSALVHMWGRDHPHPFCFLNAPPSQCIYRLKPWRSQATKTTEKRLGSSSSWWKNEAGAGSGRSYQLTIDTRAQRNTLGHVTGNLCTPDCETPSETKGLVS